MTALLDTGFLYALFDADDRHHQAVVDILSSNNDLLLLPAVVLVELSYLLQSRLGHDRMRHYTQTLAVGSIPLVTLTAVDLNRANGLLEQYADLRLDFVDAVITAIAERLKIKILFTVDKRDFAIIRPRHCDYFQTLP